MGQSKLFCSLLMFLIVGTANAGIAVTYKFEAYSSYPLPELGISSFQGSFTYISRQYFTTTPTFFTPGVWTTVSPAGLSTCNTPDGTCSKILFAPNAYSKNKWDVVEFGVKSTLTGESVGIDYYFDLGALSNPSSYVGESFSSILFSSIQFGTSQYATLTIAVSSIADPAPNEPRYDECGMPIPPNGVGGGSCVPPTSTKDLGAGVPPAPDMPPAYFPIPEPSTYAMILAGLGLLGLTKRRRWE